MPAQRPLRMLSLCSGIGGIDYAWSHVLGQEIAGQVEIDDFCNAVLARHWPDVPRLRDIREVHGDEFGAVDLVAGGIPCQPWSVAGQQRGQRDDRHLWPAMRRIIQTIRPTWVVIENVAGFAALALDDVCTDLEFLFYEVTAFMVPAAAIAAPHLRERVFVVAHASSTRLEGRGAQRATRQHRQAQSGVGGAVAGLSGWLDRHRWPAGPTEAQHEWEAPRTITGSIANRAHRLKALGNAVVPAQVAPILAAIIETHRQYAEEV